MRDILAIDRMLYYGFEIEEKIEEAEENAVEIPPQPEAPEHITPEIETEAEATELINENISPQEAFEEFITRQYDEITDDTKSFSSEGFWPDAQNSSGGREAQHGHDTPARHGVPHHPQPQQPSHHPQPHRPPQPHHTPPHNNRHNNRHDHHSGSAPRFAPPAYVPKAAPGLRAVDPGSISHCLYSFTYLWLNNRQQFWFFPTFVGRRSVAGYRWMHNNWVYMGFDLRLIDSFFCGGR